MTYSADDLAPLLAKLNRADLGYHQGRVISWDVGTAENEIAVAGGTLTNVPVLNGTEPLILQAGDIVGMMRYKSSYFIYGRILIPGQGLGALPGLMQGVGATEIGFAISTTSTPIAQAQFQVPEWANQALVMCVANATIANTSGAGEFVYLTATVSGGFGGEMYSWVADNDYRCISSCTQYLMGTGSYDVGLDGEVPLGSAITVASNLRADTGLDANPNSTTNVHATAFFRRV